MGGKNSLIELGEKKKKNKSLIEIHLDQMNLDMDNYNIIFDSIEINQNIKYYSLSYNSNLSPKLVLKFFLQKNGVETLVIKNGEGVEKSVRKLISSTENLVSVQLFLENIKPTEDWINFAITNNNINSNN